MGLEFSAFRVSEIVACDIEEPSANLIEFVMAGSWYEDDGSRPLNHFFNPVTNQRLDIPDLVAFIEGGNFSSPDWALEDFGSVTGQNYSFAHARRYYWTALTAPNATARGPKCVWGAATLN
jgi:hypothetical protein